MAKKDPEKDVMIRVTKSTWQILKTAAIAQGMELRDYLAHQAWEISNKAKITK